MTERHAEKVSMFMDDELDDYDAVDLAGDIGQDQGMKSCWERYHLISDALKNNLPPLIHHDLVERVSASLEPEPAFNNPSLKSHKANTYIKPVAALALAASLAAVAVLVTPLQDSSVSPVQEQRASLPVANVGNVVSQAEPLREKQMLGNTDESRFEPEFYDYLVNHNEYLQATSMQSNMLPYVRIVGYSSSHDGER